MTELDRLYMQILQYGFIVLRQAIDAGDCEWAKMEVDHLHNVPSMIGEKNYERHRYYWFEERVLYINWVHSLGGERQKSRMATYYEPIWNEMRNHIDLLPKI